jgi:hypothetical protein
MKKFGRYKTSGIVGTANWKGCRGQGWGTIVVGGGGGGVVGRVRCPCSFVPLPGLR